MSSALDEFLGTLSDARLTALELAAAGKISIGEAEAVRVLLYECLERLDDEARLGRMRAAGPEVAR